MAVMTPSAQEIALRWLKCEIERLKREERFVSGSGEAREILETLLEMIETTK